MKSENTVVDSVIPFAQQWQLSVVKKLTDLKKQGKLPHAILIELRTAVDSQCFGWHLVSALFCLSDSDEKPCGECSSCQLMLANNYPDFAFTTLIEDEKTHKLNKVIKINQIRQLIHQFSLTNNLQQGKVALIYPAEKLNQASANSLLKTLEEPSAESTLILLTHNAGSLPVTIRSRCQKWVVESPHHNIATEWLNQQQVPADQLSDYLSLAHNDAQLALQLYQQEYKQQQEHFSSQLNKYLLDQVDVVAMVKQLKVSGSENVRLLLKTELQKMIYNLLQNQLTKSLKQKLTGLINLLTTMDRVLQVEDNNLNLLLQLEDVIISLKQIVNK